MATVVAFFVITKIYVCNMDADCLRTERISSKREKRWSMNSQRLEEIVAELMRPISDARRSFDTDLSSLLEEYLTEAGLHALESGEEETQTVTAVPNFAELALLLQQSASIYGRKVDCLYQHVLSVSEDLHNTSEEPATPSGPDSTPRRKRRASEAAAWTAIALVSAGGARRDPAPRPPPTLPRAHAELAPRATAAAPLTDYDGDTIGALPDFACCWRLQDGLLVEELATGSEGEAWRPPALVELRDALAAEAPPSPPPPADSPPPSPPPCSPPPSSFPPPPPCGTPVPFATPLLCDTPGPFATPAPCATPVPFETPPPSSTPLPKVEKKERKRRNETKMEDVVCGSVKLLISKELRLALSRPSEFSLPARLVGRVVRVRRDRLRAARAEFKQQPRPPSIEFRDYDTCPTTEIGDQGGFCGWSGAEAAAATTEVTTALTTATTSATRRHDDSDDDGFFERSSLGDSDTSRVDDTDDAWRSRVLGAAAAAERRGVDVHAAAGAVVQALPPTVPAPFPNLLADIAREPHDVAKYFLATLFLANAGNVEVVHGPALTPGAFSVRLLSTDPARYRRTIAADAAPPPP